MEQKLKKKLIRFLEQLPFIRYLHGENFWGKFSIKNIVIIAIQHGKFILVTPLAIFPIMLGEIHSSPSGKFPYTY